MVPIAYMMWKEFRQVFRDPAMLRIIFFIPIIQLLVFAYAMTTDLKNVRVSIYDADRSRASRDLTASFTASDLFVPGPPAESPDRLRDLLRTGRTDITLLIPRGWGADLAQGRTARLGLQIDGKNSSLAGRAAGYAQAIIRRAALARTEELERERPELAERSRRVEAVSRFFYNPELESRYFMVPGILVLLITITSAMLTGISVVREREIGTLEQLMVTPLSPLQLILGKTLPFAILSFVEFGVATTFAVFWFHLPLIGSIPLLALAALIYLLVTLGAGLLASTVSSTQQQAMFTVWFFLVFGILTSGFFFPIDNMPRFVQLLTYANPLRYFMTIVRGVFLKGVMFGDIADELAGMTILGVLMFSGAVLRFRKRLA